MAVSGVMKTQDGKPQPGIDVNISCITVRILNDDEMERILQTRTNAEGRYDVICEEANRVEVSVEIPEN